ncbi:hypothetical protein [Streptosporangium canum]|uniref:hypothetical protein n=1 Tax=Streptosporangium canum TaxID=324952 RepID=UPI0011608BEE|nr:hypothetical protein [Streptosporangium canum]
MMQRLNVFIQEGHGGDLRLRTVGNEAQMKSVALQIAQLAAQKGFDPVVMASVPGDLQTIQRMIKQYKIPSAGKASIYQAQPVLEMLKGLGERLDPAAKRFEALLAEHYGEELARSQPPRKQNFSQKEKASVRGSLTDHIQALAIAGLITAEDLFAIAYRIQEWESTTDLRQE